MTDLPGSLKPKKSSDWPTGDALMVHDQLVHCLRYKELSLRN